MSSMWDPIDAELLDCIRRGDPNVAGDYPPDIVGQLVRGYLAEGLVACTESQSGYDLTMRGHARLRALASRTPSTATRKAA